MSVGYFVMGLVWKLHTGVIDESWISVLNRLRIGNLRLGSTINGLVLTSVCLLPFYVISGSLGLLGMFCRKKIFVLLVCYLQPYKYIPYDWPVFFTYALWRFCQSFCLSFIKLYKVSFSEGHKIDFVNHFLIKR